MADVCKKSDGVADMSIATSLTVRHTLKDVSNSNIPISVPTYRVLQMVLNY